MYYPPIFSHANMTFVPFDQAGKQLIDLRPYRRARRVALHSGPAMPTGRNGHDMHQPERRSLPGRTGPCTRGRGARAPFRRARPTTRARRPEPTARPASPLRFSGLPSGIQKLATRASIDHSHALPPCQDGTCLQVRRWVGAEDCPPIFPLKGCVAGVGSGRLNSSQASS